jgi:hypothetical protein
MIKAYCGYLRMTQRYNYLPKTLPKELQLNLILGYSGKVMKFIKRFFQGSDLCCTYSVNIFIDHRPACRDIEKGDGEKETLEQQQGKVSPGV